MATELMAVAAETAVLRQLIRRSLNPAVGEDWAGIEPQARLAMAAAYFLLDRAPAAGSSRTASVQFFVHETLGRLLQQLNRRTERHKITTSGRVRGTVSWSNTYKARYSGDYDPSRFVCREVRHQYDTPENQLVKYVVSKISDCLQIVPNAILGGVCYTPYEEGQEAEAVLEPVSTRLAEIRMALDHTRAHMRLRAITLPAAVDETHLARAEMSKTEEYVIAAELYGRYHRLVERLSWDEMLAAGRRSLPLPGSTGAEYEPWISMAATVLQGVSRST